MYRTRVSVWLSETVNRDNNIFNTYLKVYPWQKKIRCGLWCQSCWLYPIAIIHEGNNIQDVTFSILIYLSIFSQHSLPILQRAWQFWLWFTANFHSLKHSLKTAYLNCALCLMVGAHMGECLSSQQHGEPPATSLFHLLNIWNNA